MKPLSIMITTVIYFSSLAIPAIAGQIWQGKGEIVRGTGKGGSLELKLEVEGNTVKFLTGPSKNQRANLNLQGNRISGSVEIASNNWHFEQQNRQLIVTLYQKQPQRVVLYRLYTSK